MTDIRERLKTRGFVYSTKHGSGQCLRLLKLKMLKFYEIQFDTGLIVVVPEFDLEENGILVLNVRRGK